MPLKTGAPRGVIVCNRAFNIRKIGARGRNLLPMGFFSILRFNMRKEQIARFSQPRNPRGKHSPSVSARSAQSAQAVQATRQRLVGSVSASRASQAVARNKRSPNVSAQSAQLSQSVQSTRQCPLGSVSAVRAVRAENSALRTFRAIFFERQCVWRGRQCAPINKKPFQETTRARAPPENNCPFF